jgi:BASS family bile acid:Na+ symporter
MTIAQVILVAMQTSIWLVVLSLGLKATPHDLTYVLRRPFLLARSLLAMGVVMPLLAILLVRLMDLPSPAEVALIALALAPVPPLLPRKQSKAGGDQSYAIGLLVAASLIAMVWIPLVVELVDPYVRAPLQVTAGSVFRLLAFTLLTPLVAGVVVRLLAPGLAQRLAGLVGSAATILLLLSLLPVLVIKWRVIFAQAHDGALLALAIFVIVGLVAGYLIGGPDEDNRSVLALATACRHPGVAIALAHMNFPGEPSIAPIVLLYLLTSAVITIPFVAWLKRRRRSVAARL